MVYSFDVFDTLITRTTAEPKGIFTIMEEILRKDALYERYPLHLRRHFRQFRVEGRAGGRGRCDAGTYICPVVPYELYLPRTGGRADAAGAAYGAGELCADSG